MRKFYRTIPHIVQAVRYDGGNKKQILEWCDGDGSVSRTDEAKIDIRTLNGVETASVGDYVVRDPYHNHYPCRSAVFESGFAPAEEVRKASVSREEFQAMLDRGRWVWEGDRGPAQDGPPVPARSSCSNENGGGGGRAMRGRVTSTTI